MRKKCSESIRELPDQIDLDLLVWGQERGRRLAVQAGQIWEFDRLGSNCLLTRAVSQGQLQGSVWKTNLRVKEHIYAESRVCEYKILKQRRDGVSRGTGLKCASEPTRGGITMHVGKFP